MVKAFISLCKALISDLRSDVKRRELFIVERTPRVLGTKLRRRDNE